MCAHEWLAAGAEGGDQGPHVGEGELIIEFGGVAAGFELEEGGDEALLAPPRGACMLIPEVRQEVL